MRARWVSFVFVIIVLIIVREPGSNAAETTATPTVDPCFFANELKANGNLAGALEQYKPLAEKGERCAVSGYLVAAQTVTVAANSSATALSDSATQTADAVSTNEAAAANFVIATGTVIPTQYVPAWALDEQGFKTEAQTEYAEVVKSNPEIAPPTLLSELNKNTECSVFGRDYSRECVSAGRWLRKLSDLPEIALALGSLLILLVLLGKIVRIVRSWMRPSYTLDIVPFTAEESEQKNEDFRSAIAESVQIFYNETRKADSPSPNVKLVTEAKAEATPSIAANLETIPVASAIGAILDWLSTSLVKTKDHQLKGTMIGDPERGAGIIASLELGNSVKESRTIWFKDYFGTPSISGESAAIPENADYLALSETIALWLFKVMARERPEGKSANDADSSLLYRIGWPLEKWESYARFRNSRTVLRWGKENLAITLLENTLAQYPEFLPARMNLATLRFQSEVAMEDISGDERTMIFERYERQMQELWTGWADPHGKSDAVLRAKVFFNYLAARHYRLGWNCGTVASKDADKELGNVLAQVKIVTTRDIPIEEFFDHEFWGKPLGSDLDALDEMKPRIEYLVNTIEVQLARPGFEQILADYWDRYRVPGGDINEFGVSNYYARTCLCAAAYFRCRCSMANNRTGKSSYMEPTQWGNWALDNLERTLQLSPASKKWAKVDPSLEPLREADNEIGERFGKICEEPANPTTENRQQS